MKQRKYHSNLSLVDMKSNLLVGFVSLFILAFLLINPIADDGKIDPRTEYMITLEWDDESYVDMDMWVRGPDGRRVGYAMKEGGYMSLDRDDLGVANDSYIVNNEIVTVRRNIETLKINCICPGEYVVNTHYFSDGARYKPINEDQKAPEVNPPTKAKITVYKMEPYKVVFVGYTESTLKQEKTVVTFVIDEEGTVRDKRTDINIKIRSANAP